MEYLIIAIVLVVLILIAGGAMLVRSRRRPGPAGAPEAPPAAPPTAPPRPGEGDGVGAGQPDLLIPTVTGPPATEVAEAPPPLAGRMTRLRGRLARSQSGFGSVLLGLLSRVGLDDQGWEEIEDTLVGADIGAAPAAQLVSELRTQVRVGGAHGSGEVRALLRQDL